jgi:hypothetical protein
MSDKTTPAPVDPEAGYGTPTRTQHSPLPTTPDLDPQGADRLGLTSAEADQFRELGFVIKRGLVPAEDFAEAIDLWWQQPPAVTAQIRRDDPSTWVSPGKHWPDENRWGLAKNWMGDHPWPGPKDTRPGASVGERVGRLPHKLTRDRAEDVWRWHGIGHDPAFVNVTSAHPRVLYMVELLLGGPIKRPWRNRGIYAVFPKDPSEPSSRIGPHHDANPIELMAAVILEDIGPREGGFTVFPRSAQGLYSTSAQAHNWVATKRSEAAMDDIKVNVTPLEFTGKAGDVLFCHGLTVHSAGLQEGGRIRMASILDFNRARQRGHLRWTAAGKHGGKRINADMDGLLTISPDDGDDPDDGFREVTQQWIADSNEFVLDRCPPFEDMFHEWNLGQRPVSRHIVDEPAWWEKYGLPMLPTGSVPRGGGGTPAVPLSAVASYEGDGRWRVPLKGNDWNQAILDR